ncbi:MAG: hypothetical protein N4A49_02010 [Marinifilaceae bacterium]|jgi:hypothetical protein|nr:hypothetical protein [Marinifilaceae bacterium]
MEAKVKNALKFLKETLDDSFSDHQGEVDINREWNNVSIHNLKFQFGVVEDNQSLILRIILFLDEIKHDIEYEKLEKELDIFNDGDLNHMLRESDNYFCFKSNFLLENLDCADKRILVRKINRMIQSSEYSELVAFIGKYKKW